MMRGVIHVVDDDASVRDSLSMLLSLRGLNTRNYESGIAFLQAHQTEPDGCILVDLRMPLLDGLAFQRELLSRGWHIPCVVMSAYGDVATTRQALKNGAVDFLEKPLDDVNLLVDTIAAALRHHAVRRSENLARARAQNLMHRLTARESQVMKLLAQGLAHRDIGNQLRISPRTVEVYKARLFEKLQVQSIAELVRLHDAAARDGLV